MRSGIVMAGLVYGASLAALVSSAGCDGSIDLGTNDSGATPEDAGTAGAAPDAASTLPSVLLDGADGGVTTATGGRGDIVVGFDGGTSRFGYADGGGGGTARGGVTEPDATFVDPTDCEIDCSSAAANGCDIDLNKADSECVTLCARSPSASQLDCLEATPCAALGSALEGNSTICGIVPHDAGLPVAVDAGGGPVDPSDCQDECDSAAANGCNLDLSKADRECLKLCAKSPTEGQLDCLEATPCASLLSALAGGPPICGI